MCIHRIHSFRTFLKCQIEYTSLSLCLSGLSKRIAGHGNNDCCFHPQVPTSDSRVVCGHVSVHSLHVCVRHHELPSLADRQRHCVSYCPMKKCIQLDLTVHILTVSTFPSRLTAIRDHSSGMKSPQKKAFVKRLLQSSVVGDVPTWPPYFLTSILPLLPYLPVSHFQQLTSQQVVVCFA